MMSAADDKMEIDDSLYRLGLILAVRLNLPSIMYIF